MYAFWQKKVRPAVQAAAQKIESTLPKYIPVLSDLGFVDTRNLAATGFNLGSQIISHTVPYAGEILAGLSFFGITGKVFNAIQTKYTQFLTSSDQASLDQSFNQSNFIQLVNRHYPAIALNENGICYGLVRLWYIFLQMGMELTPLLQMITEAINQEKALDEEQIELLKTIEQMQENQHDLKTQDCGSISAEKLLVVETINSQNMRQGLNKIVNEAIRCALETPGRLIDITPISSTAAHAIGLVAQRTAEGQMIIRYFDPNNRQMIFDISNDTQAAQEAITNLMHFAYEPFYCSNTLLGSSFTLAIKYYDQLQETLANQCKLSLDLPAIDATLSSIQLADTAEDDYRPASIAQP